jgi:iron complex transport system permease protein
VRRSATLSLIAAPVVIFLLSFMIGRYPVPPWTVLRVILADLLPAHWITPDWPVAVRAVVMDVRLPRIAAAMLVGSGLSLSGACYQGVFRNPLISPFILGVSAGAGFGAALAILLVPWPDAVPLFAFAFGLLAVAMCYGLARSYRAAPTLVLVLAGVVVGALFTALLSLLKYVADPESKLPVIEFWLLGSLSGVSGRDVWLLLAPFLPGAAVLLALRWRINLLAVGDEEARGLGIDTVRLRAAVIVVATLIAASTVAVAGIIGWVGLVIPHAARILVGADFRRVLPASVVLGACYLMVVDDAARTVTAAELPIGVLTAIIGAPVFALLLRRKALGWA